MQRKRELKFDCSNISLIDLSDLLNICIISNGYTLDINWISIKYTI